MNTCPSHSFSSQQLKTPQQNVNFAYTSLFKLSYTLYMRQSTCFQCKYLSNLRTFKLDTINGLGKIKSDIILYLLNKKISNEGMRVQKVNQIKIKYVFSNYYNSQMQTSVFNKIRRMCYKLIINSYQQMGLLFAKVTTQHLKIEFGRQNNPQRPFNGIRTTKYSVITFFPKALILQFTRVANFVYLISAILQSITIISSLSPITAIGPLFFVIFVGIIRQGYQDYKRHTKDVQVNERITLRLQMGVFKQIKWENVKAGDIIKVLNNQIIPCDIAILYTTGENSICYVQTSNLDGQTNLKNKFAFVDQIHLYPDQFDLLQGFLQVEKPNSDLYQFNGRIKLINHEQKSLAFQNLLLRQTHLRNTIQIVGIAVYCGSESKIMMNKGRIQHKITRVQKKVNYIQFSLFVVLIILCIVSSVGFYIDHNQLGRNNLFYLKDIGVSLQVQAILIFFTCFLLLNFLIPISLNVLLQFIKAFLTGFLSFDRKFYDQFCDGIHVGNMSIMQQLGVVDYILTDKTGTLTANQMVFKSCCIKDMIYPKQVLEEKIQNLAAIKGFHNFWLAVVICHDVIKDEENQKYQGSSPDEVCFVQFARRSLGYEFLKRTKKHIELRIRGQKIVYELLDIIPFSSRRRMSVIVKALCENNQILMLTKGADSSIFSNSIQYKYQESFQQHINQYAIQGLRTLVFAYKKMTIEQFNRFQLQKKNIAFDKFNKTKTLDEVQQLHLALIEQVESKLNILGATAIQDKLQDKVPQTIARLQEAGMTVMMITGDKLETAENIGYLANLIKKEFKIVRIRSNVPDARELATGIVEELQRGTGAQIGVIIQGTSIKKIVEEEDPLVVEIYVKLLKKCTSVIFCRSSPKEKALIVKFVKHKLGGVVLAVGDGGNDIGMIEQANIGVGILGREGKSAATVSDFYFGQFKHLDRLLLHHGRWFYMRISYFFVYYGWKNLIMTSLMFMYITRSAYSGYPAFSEFYITMYNLLIGMYLIGYYGVWQQDINDDIHPDVWQKLPLLYKSDKQRDLFSYKRYLIWTLMGVAIAFVLEYWINIALGYGQSSVDQQGHPITYDSLYLIKSISIVIVTLLVVIMDLKTFTWYTIAVAIMLFTIGFLVLVMVLENLSYFGRGYRSLIDNDSTKFYLVLVIVTGVTIAVKMIIRIGQVEFFPTQIDKILKEKYQKGLLSIQNLTEHILPKDLFEGFKEKIKNHRKQKNKNKILAHSSRTKDKIFAEIQLNPKDSRAFQQ